VLNVSARWISQNLRAHYRHQWAASSQELLCLSTSNKELFCHQLITANKMWIYYWDPISKLEFMQWKDVDCPTSAEICNSAINWLDYRNSFFTARCYASVVLAMALCLSIRLSQVGVLSKRLNESSWVLACELPSTRPTLC